MNTNMSYLEFEEYLIDTLTENGLMLSVDWNYSNEMLKKVGSNGLASMCEDVELILDAIWENLGYIDNNYAAYNLTWILTKAVLKITKAGHLNYAIRYMRFLKYGLFEQLVHKRYIGIAMERAVYRATRLPNEPICGSGRYYDILRKRQPNEYDHRIEIDVPYITVSYAEFFLKMDKNNYFSDEDRQFLEEIVEDYQKFKTYIDADEAVVPKKRRDSSRKYSKKIPDTYQYEKEAKELYKTTSKTWPALAYSIAEIYHHYKMRLKIAKRIADSVENSYPDIEPVRSSEMAEVREQEQMAKLRKSLLILAAFFSVCGFIGYKLFNLFNTDPGILGWIIVIVLGFIFFTAINPFTLFFLWFFKD